MANQPLKGLPRLAAAWRNSCAGLRDIWRSEEAFRLEIYVAVLATPTAFWVASDLFQAVLLIVSVLLVALVEVINTAIEAVVDRIGPERHELSRIAKDLGSLAVLMAAGLSGLLWTAALLSD